jgi:hypothetical protein
LGVRLTTPPRKKILLRNLKRRPRPTQGCRADDDGDDDGGDDDDDDDDVKGYNFKHESESETFWLDKASSYIGFDKLRSRIF